MGAKRPLRLVLRNLVRFNYISKKEGSQVLKNPKRRNLVFPQVVTKTMPIPYYNNNVMSFIWLVLTVKGDHLLNLRAVTVAKKIHSLTSIIDIGTSHTLKNLTYFVLIK